MFWVNKHQFLFILKRTAPANTKNFLNLRKRTQIKCLDTGHRPIQYIRNLWYKHTFEFRLNITSLEVNFLLNIHMSWQSPNLQKHIPHPQLLHNYRMFSSAASSAVCTVAHNIDHNRYKECRRRFAIARNIATTLWNLTTKFNSWWHVLMAVDVAQHQTCQHQGLAPNKCKDV